MALLHQLAGLMYTERIYLYVRVRTVLKGGRVHCEREVIPL